MNGTVGGDNDNDKNDKNNETLTDQNKNNDNNDDNNEQNDKENKPEDNSDDKNDNNENKDSDENKEDDTNDNNNNSNNDDGDVVSKNPILSQGQSFTLSKENDLFHKIWHEYNLRLNDHSKVSNSNEELAKELEESKLETERMNSVIEGYRTQMKFLQERLKNVDKPKQDHNAGVNGRRQSKVMVVKTKISAEIQREPRKMIQYSEVLCFVNVTRAKSNRQSSVVFCAI